MCSDTKTNKEEGSAVANKTMNALSSLSSFFVLL